MEPRSNGRGGRLPPAAAAVVLAGAVAAIALVSLRAFSRQFIYLPWRWTPEEARASNPGHDEVWIEAAGGVRLHGWLQRGERKGIAALLCHGNAGNLGVQEGLLWPYRRLGVTALLFDYRGYGLSGGRPDEEGIAADTLAAFGRLQEITGLEPGRILIHGKSLGGAPAVRAAIERGAGGLVLESAFTSAVDLGRHHYPFLPIGWILEDRLDVAGRLAGVLAPTLILHGERDDIVPPEHARRLAEASGGRARAVLLPRSGHNDTFAAAPAAYLAALGEFIDTIERNVEGRRSTK